MTDTETSYTIGSAAIVTGKNRLFFDDEVKAKLAEHGARLVRRGRGTSIPRSALEAIGLTVDDSLLESAGSSADTGVSKSGLANSVKRRENKIATLSQQLADERSALRKEKKALADFDKKFEKTKAKADAKREQARQLLEEAEALEALGS